MLGQNILGGLLSVIVMQYEVNQWLFRHHRIKRRLFIFCWSRPIISWSRNMFGMCPR